MITMAICNTVVVSRRAKSSSLENGNVDCANIYEAESPDEYALVEVSHYMYMYMFYTCVYLSFVHVHVYM